MATDKVTMRRERIQEIELEQPSAIAEAAPTPPTVED